MYIRVVTMHSLIQTTNQPEEDGAADILNSLGNLCFVLKGFLVPRIGESKTVNKISVSNSNT